MAKKITKNLPKWYKDMLLWRKFEDKSAALYTTKIRGFLHLYNGQEAVLAGYIEAINPKKDRFITSQDLNVALGVEPKYIMAEMFGKITGCFEGNGINAYAQQKLSFFGRHGIVGTIPLEPDTAL